MISWTPLSICAAIGCRETATEHTCQGILLTLQNMTGCQDNFTLVLLKQVCLTLTRCIGYNRPVQSVLLHMSHSKLTSLVTQLFPLH